MRGFQHMPAADGPKRRIVAMLERDRWVGTVAGIDRGKGTARVLRRPSADLPGGLVQVRLDTSKYGTREDEMLRLLDALAARITSLK